MGFLDFGARLSRPRSVDARLFRPVLPILCAVFICNLVPCVVVHRGWVPPR